MDEKLSWRENGLHAVILLIASGLGAGVVTLAGVPAGILIGAVLGSIAANRLLVSSSRRLGPSRPLANVVSCISLVLLGCLVAVRVDVQTLRTLAGIAFPMFVAIALLLVLNVALAGVLVARYRVDALTAVFACVPGGLDAVVIMAQQQGARMGVVLAIHTARLLAVVLVVIPLVVWWLGGGT